MSRLSETFTIGSLEVAALSDGAADRSLGGFVHGMEPAEWTSAVGISAPGGKLRRVEGGYRFKRIYAVAEKT